MYAEALREAIEAGRKKPLTPEAVESIRLNVNAVYTSGYPSLDRLTPLEANLLGWCLRLLDHVGRKEKS